MNPHTALAPRSAADAGAELPGQRLRHWFRGLLRANFRPAQADAAPRARRAAATFETFVESLGDFGDSQERLIGRVHLLSLRSIRERLGPHWEAYRERVTSTAEAVVASHLGRTALHASIGEDGFVVVMPFTDKLDGKVQCALLIDKIQKRILGDGAKLKDVAVATFMGFAGGRAVLDESDAAAILEAFAGGAEDGGPPPAAAPAGADQRQHAAAEFAAAPHVRLVPEPVDFVFVPMWNAYRGAITGFHCIGRHRTPQGALLSGYQMLPGRDNSSFAPELDLRTLRAAIAALQRMKEDGKRAIIGVAVNPRSLESAAARRCYAEVAAQLPDDQRHLCLAEIVGLPPDAPESRVAALVATLKPFFRHVAVRVAIDDRCLSRFRYLGIATLSANLADSAITKDAMRSHFKRFCADASRLGFVTVARGLATTDAVALAVTAGFDYVDGEAVVPAADRPGPMVRFGIDDLYR
ncbi:MAG: EAL domain-containing protein [Alphaproteobacteria bacterium]|nr:EAL domain-containing protein [Alphaproteobacteria bacterium]